MKRIFMIRVLCLLAAISFMSCSQGTGVMTARSAGTTVFCTTTKELRSDMIPDYVFDMASLRQLCVTGDDCDYRVLDDAGNDITECWMIGEIPAQISRLQVLEELRLNLNAIQSLPAGLTSLRSLNLLDLTDNSALNDIGVLSRMTSLQYLYLFGCNLKALPSGIGNLKQLKELGLAGNSFDEKEKARIRKALPGCHIVF